MKRLIIVIILNLILNLAAQDFLDGNYNNLDDLKRNIMESIFNNNPDIITPEIRPATTTEPPIITTVRTHSEILSFGQKPSIDENYNNLDINTILNAALGQTYEEIKNEPDMERIGIRPMFKPGTVPNVQHPDPNTIIPNIDTLYPGNRPEPTRESPTTPTVRGRITTPTVRGRTTTPTVRGRTTPSLQCIQSETLSSGQKPCKGELIFEETFETNQLNSRVWSKEIRIPSDHDDADFISYQDLPENCYIQNNNLYIVPTLLENTNGFNEDSIKSGILNFDDRCTAERSNYQSECTRTAEFSRILPPIVSARIGTRKHFSFRYGRIEIKAKLPKGDWIFPQLLLEPYSKHPYGDKGYASGQVRIAFIRGNDYLDNKNRDQIDGYRLYGGVVLTVGEELREKFLVNTISQDHFSDNFHIYSMVWTNESMKFELDGSEYGQINGGLSDHQNLTNLKQSKKWKNGDFMAPFDKEFFISLGVSAGGISDFPDGCKNGRRGNNKPWTNKDPKCELRFWDERKIWHSTWNGENSGLKVDYIKVWAL